MNLLITVIPTLVLLSKDVSKADASNGSKRLTSNGKCCTGTLDRAACEEHCLMVTEVVKKQNITIKECVCIYYCDNTTACTATLSNTTSLICCKGNLCNEAQHLVQSIFILLASAASVALIQ